MIKTPSIKVDPHLLTILRDEHFNSFTVTQLKDAYLAELGANYDPIEARKFTYRQILRFVRIGLFKKESTDKPNEVRYHKTIKFRQ